jgi:hypothetical protein
MPARRRLLSFASVSLLLIVGAAYGCSGADDTDEAVDVDESANTVAKDRATATEMLALLGGPNGKCTGCHAPTASQIRVWGNAMKAVDTACFVPTSMTAAQRIACLKDGTTFESEKLGLYTAGARLTQFKALFDAAYPASQRTARFNEFKNAVAMPRNSNVLTAAQFAKLKTWVLRGMPQLDQAAQGDAGVDSGADTGTGADAGNGCTPTITNELKAHINQMKLTGWGARLADQATPMYGCGTATNALGCLTSLNDVAPQIGATGVVQKIRRLRAEGSTSSFWVRSSADGRFVAFGGSWIADLTKPETAPTMPVNAAYDPYFLPSNDGFAYAGAPNGGITLCKQSLITDAAAQPGSSIDMSGPKCTNVASSVYESIGTSLDGVRYFLTYGSHVNDDTGSGSSQSSADFGVGASTTFVPMKNNGTAYLAEASTSLTLDHEGDLMLSPSTLLAATRFAVSATSRHGYRVRLVKAVRNGATTTVTAPLGGEYCVPGGKPALSFNERFLAVHQYVDTTQPDQAGLAPGSSNIVVVDLLTGLVRRITKMPAGQYATYPHFRADGWLYFIVRDTNAGNESLLASDVALRMATP